MTINGENWNFTITYKEIINYSKLKWIVNFEGFPSKETHVELEFHKIPNGTLLKLKMENFEDSNERDANRNAWINGLKTLEKIIGK